MVLEHRGRVALSARSQTTGTAPFTVRAASPRAVMIMRTMRRSSELAKNQVHALFSQQICFHHDPRLLHFGSRSAEIAPPTSGILLPGIRKFKIRFQLLRWKSKDKRAPLCTCGTFGSRRALCQTMGFCLFLDGLS